MPNYAEAKDVDQPDWEPLIRLIQVLAATPGAPRIEPADFMYMWRLEARGRPRLHLYKHIDTRRYLNIDDAGDVYLYAGETRPGTNGRTRSIYEPLPDVWVAIERLELSLVRPTEPSSDGRVVPLRPRHGPRPRRPA